MTRTVAKVAGAAFVMLLAGTDPRAQTPDAAGILRATREALGGEDRLGAVKSLVAIGRTRAESPRGGVEEHDVALSVELPDKFVKRSVLLAMGPTSVYRNAGFNGDRLIDDIDAPPMLSGGGPAGGGVIVRRLEGPPGANGPRQPTPEERAAEQARRLGQARREFARLTLGMFATGFGGYPLTFTYAGRAESADGAADVLEVSDGAEFKARLFIDVTTRLPLMLTWMDLEPVMIDVEENDNGQRVRIGPARPRIDGAAPAEPASFEEQMRRAQAERRTVEFQTFYGDYQAVDGVLVPMRLSQSIDGRPRDEIVFDRVRLNTRIDPNTFEPGARQN
jgi:hypothetical protein